MVTLKSSAPLVSSKLFSWSRESRHMTLAVGEMSTVQGVLNLPIDKIPSELHIKSRKTGMVLPFYLNRTEKDCEGDLVKFFYQPANRGDIRLIVYND